MDTPLQQAKIKRGVRPYGGRWMTVFRAADEDRDTSHLVPGGTLLLIADWTSTNNSAMALVGQGKDLRTYYVEEIEAYRGGTPEQQEEASELMKKLKEETP